MGKRVYGSGHIYIYVYVYVVDQQKYIYSSPLRGSEARKALRGMPPTLVDFQGHADGHTVRCEVLKYYLEAQNWTRVRGFGPWRLRIGLGFEVLGPGGPELD